MSAKESLRREARSVEENEPRIERFEDDTLVLESATH